MLYFIALFIIPLILTFQPTQGTALVARITCEDACSVAILQAVGGDPNATTCTNAINEQYAACLDCQAQEGHEAESDEQPDYNEYISFCVTAGFRIKNVTIDGAWAAFNQSSGSQTNNAAGQVGVGGFGMVAWFVGIVGVGLLDLVSTL
ncbi:hypothetical protein B0H13DRAFT_2327417 [Mycena leptocephala]|nr:hypothetical protein B0H13DRAFT_2327417 [Mycena leptocephala]